MTSRRPSGVRPPKALVPPRRAPSFRRPAVSSARRQSATCLANLPPRNIPYSTASKRFPRLRLPYPKAIERASQRIDDAVRDRPVILVPMVERGHIIETNFQHGLDEKLDPFRSYASQVGIHHRASLHPEGVSDLEYGPEGASLSGYAVIHGRYRIGRLNGMGNEYGLMVPGGRGPDDIHGAVGGAAVHHDIVQPRVALAEDAFDGLGDELGVVEARCHDRDRRPFTRDDHRSPSFVHRGADGLVRPPPGFLLPPASGWRSRAGPSA